MKAVNDSPFVGKGCLHTLQLTIKNSLQVQENVSEAITSGRRIVTHFNHPALAQEKLLQIQNELNLPKHKLVQDVSTRWNSMFYICEPKKSCGTNKSCGTKKSLWNKKEHF